MDTQENLHGDRPEDARLARLLGSAPARVSLAGDWHGAGRWGARCLQQAAAQNSAGVLQLGDLGIWPGRDGTTLLDTLERAVDRAGIPLWFVDGNHEDFWQLLALPVDPATGLRQLRPGVYHLPRGTRWSWHGLTWLALGGATSLDRVGRTEGVSWWPEEALTIADADRAVAGGPVDVMVTHDAPAGVTVPGAGSYLWREETMNASYLNRELLREVVDVVGPTHLFHGHFHTAYTADLDLGGDLHAAIRGLDKENAGLRNLVHLDLAELGADSAARRVAAAAWAGQHESR
jgi:hypothetical protein